MIDWKNTYLKVFRQHKLILMGREGKGKGMNLGRNLGTGKVNIIDIQPMKFSKK